MKSQLWRVRIFISLPFDVVALVFSLLGGVFAVLSEIISSTGKEPAPMETDYNAISDVELLKGEF